MSFFNRISQKQFNIDVNIQGQLSQVIALKNQLIFLYFLDGSYQLWNILDQTGPLKEGKTNANIKYMKAIDENYIVFYDQSKFQMKVIDLTTNSEFQNFSPLVPTALSLTGTNRNDLKAVEEIVYNTQLITFQESKNILICEKKFTFNSINTENIITVYSFQNSQDHINQQSLQLSSRYSEIRKLDENAMILIWMSCFSDKQIAFYTYNTLEKGPNKLKEYKFSYKISGTIVDATVYDQNSVSFWCNMDQHQPNNSPNHQNSQQNNNNNQQQQQQQQLVQELQNGSVHIFNMETSEERSINLQEKYQEEFLLTNVIEVNWQKKRVILKRVVDIPTIDILSLPDFKVTDSKEIKKSMFQDEFSLDFDYYVEYQKEYEQEEIQDQDQDGEEKTQKLLVLNSLVGIRSTLLYLLEKLGIVNIYGENMAQQVVDMLSISSNQQIEYNYINNNDNFDNEINSSEDNNEGVIVGNIDYSKEQQMQIEFK